MVDRASTAAFIFPEKDMVHSTMICRLRDMDQNLEKSELIQTAGRCPPQFLRLGFIGTRSKANRHEFRQFIFQRIACVSITM